MSVLDPRKYAWVDHKSGSPYGRQQPLAGAAGCATMGQESGPEAGVDSLEGGSGPDQAWQDGAPTLDPMEHPALLRCPSVSGLDCRLFAPDLQDFESGGCCSTSACSTLKAPSGIATVSHGAYNGKGNHNEPI
jgi:hypothetical protein